MERKGGTKHGRTDRRVFSFGGFGGPARLLLSAVPALAAVFFMTVFFWPASKETPEVLRVGVVPDQSPEILRQRFQPLLDYLSVEIGMPFQLVVPGDYSALLDMFQKREIDIAYFGGFTFLKARESSGARALVMRDVDTRFRSSFLARTNRPETTIADFLDKKLTYSGAHDETAMLVRDGEVDLGVMNSEILEAMFRDGRLRRDMVRVVDQTPTYANYVWTMRVGIESSLYDRVVLAFLKLSPVDAKDAAILRNLGAGGFFPARESEFGPLRKIAISLGLLG
jgi:phosphonate transport system substrate-binding protein